MKKELRDMLAGIRKRAARPGGIGLAAWYAKSVQEAVAGDDKLAKRFFGEGGSFAFEQAMKQAGRKLVFRNGTMKVTAGKAADTLKIKSFGEPTEKFKKRLKEATGGGDLKACMHLEAILTSGKRDRDGDVLHPKGAQIDPGMPLLWQHNAAQPIGRHLAVTKRDDTEIRSHLAIADTPLGRDAAELVAFGALRISHGFNPLEYEPLSEDEAKGTPGWNVKTYEMMEASLVSIPSNTDAVITAFSREKLHSPFMKAWAKGLMSARKKTVKGGWEGGKGGSGAAAAAKVNVNLDVAGLLKQMTETIEKAKQEALKKKRHQAKADDDEEEDGQKDDSEGGSLLEQVRSELQALAASGELSDETAARVNAMVITVSEAIGAERAGGGAAPAPEASFDDDEGKDDDEDGQFSDEGKDDDEDDEEEKGEDEDDEEDKDSDDDAEEKDDDAEDKDDEDAESKGWECPGCGQMNEDGASVCAGCDMAKDDDAETEKAEDEQGWDGEDMDDPDLDNGGAPKGLSTADDAAAYLSFALAGGAKLSKRRMQALVDALSTRLMKSAG